MRPTFLSVMSIATGLALLGCNPDSRTDYDGDGVTADVDCDDLDESVGEAQTWFLDEDGDGFGGESAASQESCTRPTDGLWSLRSGDCDDASTGISPGAEESCNDVDDDCDGFVDEATDRGVWFADTDGDGFGDPDNATDRCDGTGGYVQNSLDCDDTSADVRPGSTEICDGIDNDCDARVDEPDAADAQAWYLDIDGDGYGQTLTEVVSCEGPSDNWSTGSNDCDDQNPLVSPAADEICDGYDNNCDGLTDDDTAVDATTWYADDDEDSYGDDDDIISSCRQPEGYVAVGGDCDDRQRFLSPETPWYADSDGDSYGDPDVFVASCLDPSSGADTYVSNAADCDDSDSDVDPTAAEECDGIDNDCNGSVDGGDAIDADTYYMDFDGDGFGALDRAGQACSAPPGFVADATDCDDDERYVYPGADEFCDGIDNDCDGLVDRSDPDVTNVTWYQDADEDGFGRSDVTLVQCEVPEGYVLEDGDCADGNKDVNPDAIEVCDAGLDNDCDGLVDRADPDMTGDGTWYRDGDSDGLGDGDVSITTCSEPSGFVRNDDDCDDSDADLGPPRDCWDGALTFTTCGASGQSGPTQSACDSAYSGTDLESVTVSSGKQKWVVPFDGTFRIEAWGAASAGATYTSYPTGAAKGARMRGDFALEKDDVLYFAVGQRGTGAYYGSGGGGGSFVVDDADDPLLIAGGGGGVYYFVGYYSRGRAGCPGLAGEYSGRGTTSTSSGSCPVNSSRLGQGGSAYSSVGSGGGGLDSSGATNTRGTTGGGGWGNGLKGGAPTTTTSRYIGYGGYGGGGGAYFGGGGGGGYSGGNSGYRGGGGGSYNGGINESNASGVNDSNGKIVIDYVED